MERNEVLYDYQTLDVLVEKGFPMIQREVRIPDGEIIGIGVVAAYDPGQMVNFSLLDNNNEVLRPASTKFCEKTNGGDWVSSLRPVNIAGARTLTARFTIPSGDIGFDTPYQVLFCILKPVN